MFIPPNCSFQGFHLKDEDYGRITKKVEGIKIHRRLLIIDK